MCVALNRICVKKAERLKGNIQIQGSKNTVLPIIASTVLCSGISKIHNCPCIKDVDVMIDILKTLGADVEFTDHVLTVDTTNIKNSKLLPDFTGKLRSSVMFLGPLIGRYKEAYIGYPGGCLIGTRPIDMHLEGLVQMNVGVRLEKDQICCKTYYLQGNVIHLRFPSVGATENLVMAAVLAYGRTIIRNSAKEPEVIELCNHLCNMGALIEGIGTDTLIIKGVSRLYPADYCNVFDRIVAGTYMLAAAAVKSDINLIGIDHIDYIKNVIETAVRLGVNVVKKGNVLTVSSLGKVKKGEFATGIYPGFPTDLQPVLMAVLLKGDGVSHLTESIFENRFGLAKELGKLGADVSVEEEVASVFPCKDLKGNDVYARDLRGGAALVVAGMLSEGITTVHDIRHVLRGYEDIVDDMRTLGVDIQYISC